jgi:hypothetical protein
MTLHVSSLKWSSSGGHTVYIQHMVLSLCRGECSSITKTWFTCYYNLKVFTCYYNLNIKSVCQKFY